MSTQLEGIITIATIDYSDEIHSFVLNPTRQLVTEQPTYADASANDKAGASMCTVTIEMKNELAAASLARALWTAYLTDSAELAFSAQYAPGAVGSDNPAFTGNLVVSEITIGTKAGDTRVLSQTFPVNSLAIDTTP
jgi:hypothetical protein